MEHIRMRSRGRVALFRIYLRVHAYKHTGMSTVNQVLDTRQKNSPSERTASVGVYQEEQFPRSSPCWNFHHRHSKPVEASPPGLLLSRESQFAGACGQQEDG